MMIKLKSERLIAANQAEKEEEEVSVREIACANVL